MAHQLLDRWYAAIRAGDVTALAAVTTENVTIRWNGPVGVVPWAGVWEGRPKAVAFFKRVTEHLEVLSIRTVSTLEAPDTVVIVLEGHWRVRATRRDLVVRACNLFRFEDGRVACYEVYPDSAAFVAALGLPHQARALELP